MALAGRATATGTARYAARFPRPDDGPREGAPPRLASGHFRSALGLTWSSIGLGTNLGDTTDEVDACYRAALAEAIRLGCNVLDTAGSYRAQRSEIALGQAVADLAAAGEFARDELVIASKAGFIPYRLEKPADPVQYAYDSFVASGVAEPDDWAGGIHCMAPGYLSQQIAWSLRNTGLRALDIYYIHNPEMQLAFVDRATFRKRLQLAFARLEEEVAAGRIGCYGVSTWESLRRPPQSASYMSLETMIRLVTEVAGPNHHFRVVQLPLNVGMTESATLRIQPVRDSLLTTLEAARDLGLTVLASAALGQGQLPERALTALVEAFPLLATTRQRALQFARSQPGVTTALMGTTQVEHVRENLAVAAYPPEPERAHRLAHALTR